MSTLPDNDFDLEKLFLPAWAQEDAAASAKYAKYEGEQERPDRRGDRRGPRPPRRDGPRPGGDRRGPRPGQDRGPRPGGEARGGGDRQRSFPRRQEPRERREPPPPLPEVDLSLVPDEKGVESLARQIKMTGRAYPLFDIAQMILQKPERHNAVFKIKKNPEGQPIQPLFVCALDDSLWLSEEDAIGHALRKHFATFYQTERTPTDPPKGKYTFVAQCGMSGVILGPPNHHDYQNQLRKLHAERFSRMPFEAFKSRVRIVRDEEVVKKWVEDQSFKTEFICLNLPEPLRLGTMEEVEKHFRETHKENIIKQVESHTLTGQQARNLRSHELARLFRTVHDDQRRFPLQIATVLSQQFAGHGLQFFKVNKTVTHVCVARPHYLDLAAAPVSEGVKRIVEFIDAHPKSNRRTLVEALAPTPPLPVTPPPPAENAPATASGSEAAASAPPAPAAPAEQRTPEQTAIIGDLHWLIHQGHVIEFANGVLETAKKPLPKPPKPEKPAKPAETQPAAPTPETAPTPAPEAGSTAPAGESVAAQPASETAPSETPAPAPETPPQAEPLAPVAAEEPAPAPAVAETVGSAEPEKAPEPAPVSPEEQGSPAPQPESPSESGEKATS